MKRTIGKVLAALMLSAGMVGIVATAHAGGYTMIPASAGLPQDTTMTYYAELNGRVLATPASGQNLVWIVPAPNNTGMSGNAAFIDFGYCASWCTGGGEAIDYLGNYEAFTNTVQFSSSNATSQYVAFGTGFQKTWYTYVTYWMGLGSTGQVNGVEYYQQ